MTIFSSSENSSRGRTATSPSDIPSSGWRDIAWRVKDELNNDNVSVVAAGVSFYIVLALFPALAAIVSLYGLFMDPHDIERHMTLVSSLLPQEARAIIDEQLKSVTKSAESALSLGALGGVLLALYSASKGMTALITSLNIAYDEKETRGFMSLTGLALLLTFGLIIFVIIALAFITLFPVLLESIGIGQLIQALLMLLGWPLMGAVVMFGLAVLYRYGPCRNKPQWQWVSWGSGIAAFLWITGSVLFSLYVENFGKYNETYGSLGSAVVLFMWFFVTAYIVVLGAEVNAEMERQTKHDTTVGLEEPIGERGAYAADTVGKVP
ncbi:MAG: ribonuclease [Nitrospirales bacterium]|nr:MAG: ribonuclease [Nitrospirales bacterium]